MNMIETIGMFLGVLLLVQSVQAATVQKAYYAHTAVEDSEGVIAPWYTGQNGQLDERIRISVETLKRYPWVGTDKAVMAAPHFVYTSMWSIDAEGNIGAPELKDWMCGDLGQRTVSLINGMADYYRYSGDPAAVAIITMQADYILAYAQTGPDHPWPNFPISVPTKGKPYGKCEPNGFIQLDLSADIGSAVLRAYRITGEERYAEAAKHWADLLAEHCNFDAGEAPWTRYANPEAVSWSNELTGSMTLILHFLDQVIRLGYKGENDRILLARDVGRNYLNKVLLERWTAADTWGRYYWDWECPVYCLAGLWAGQYLMECPEAFHNWKQDARNVISLILHRTGVDPASLGEVYSGAWAVPESPSCCGLSLSYGQQLTAAAIAQYAALTGDAWAREVARRMSIMSTYDAREDGSVIDGLNGTPIVAGTWLNIIHPLAIRFVMQTMGWLPELFGPNRENHIMRTTAEVTQVFYDQGRVAYTTFDTPENTYEVLRLAFIPKTITANNQPLSNRDDLSQPGYMVTPLSNGDCIVMVRHDGAANVVVEGEDPMQLMKAEQITFSGTWEKESEGRLFRSESNGSALECAFTGNQVRILGDVMSDGGLADVFIDGVKQRAGFDAWNPQPRNRQVIFSKSGLKNEEHTVKVVVRGEKNLLSSGTNVRIAEIQYSAATGESGFGAGGGLKDVQRMVFGYPGREDLTDTAGNAWRPALEWVVRLGANADSVAAAWWTDPVKEEIGGTDFQEIYRYGAHAPEFVVNVTVGPGAYYAKILFAATRGIDTSKNLVTVLINGQPVIEKMDVALKAGGANRALDLTFNSLKPKNGVIEFRFIGGDKERGINGEASVQALEVGPETAPK
ncbi:MAG TPA: hypothetical protein PLI09_07215 [Candidatus Hydrogenedentes bacterium]|nr:hypothetical protein [Candidatus Hydrogenedentota bacterium]